MNRKLRRSKKFGKKTTQGKTTPTWVQEELNRALTLHQAGNFAQAKAAYKKILKVVPQHADILNLLGAISLHEGNYQEAEYSTRKALQYFPERVAYQCNLGSSLKGQGRIDEAIALFEGIIVVSPEFGDAHQNVAGLYRFKGEFRKAVDSYKRAIEINKMSDDSYDGLGLLYNEAGLIDKAIGYFKRAIAINPTNQITYSNYLYALNYNHGLAAVEVFREHRKWEERFAKRQEQNTATSGKRVVGSRRKIRVGYVSADFRTHSVAYFFEPLLEGHDRGSFKIFCYSNSAKVDKVTARIKSKCDHWYSLVGLSDAEAAQKIRGDKIDILVDLAGHTGKNRLLTFALKPAPVQVTWLGYPNTTGLKSIDYRLVDAITDPAGEADSVCSEKLIRLKGGFLCYRGDDSLLLKKPPYRKNGYLTFGSFNNCAKISSEEIKVWSTILKAVPDSKLVLKSRLFNDSFVKDCLKSEFIRAGIAPERLVMLGLIPKYRDHMEHYGEIDIALDPLLYNGTTTTFEALWMGVPVVVCRGDRHASRVGTSIMTHLGGEEFVAEERGEYIQLAISLAVNKQRLDTIRLNMRHKLRFSSLCAVKGFSEGVENCYREFYRIKG